MTDRRRIPPGVCAIPSSTTALSRRAALLAPLVLPLALTGCDLFSNTKPPIPGTREAVLAPGRGLSVDKDAPKVVLPPAVRNAAWPQAGGNPAHLMGHLAANDRLAEVWKARIGEGGGYRQVILAQPVVSGGMVFTMDSDAVVRAFRLADGSRIWRVDSKPKHTDSTNVGGGLGLDQSILYAVNGLSQLVALDMTDGKQRWRRDIGVPARSAPTIADGRIFLTTIDDHLLAFAAEDGRQLWTYQAAEPVTALLGHPAPAYYQGLVIAGFGSGELAALRAESGSVVWTDGLGAQRGRSSVADFLSIRGAPVIDSGQVFAISMGGLLVSNDVPTGRRLWERQVAGEETPFVAGDWLFVISVQQELAAVHLADGKIAWITDLPRWKNPPDKSNTLTWYGPLLVEDRLIVTGTSDDSLSVSPYTGEILGHQKLSAAAAPLVPVIADGTVLIIINNGQLLALR
ncbi:PQQ-binding-like beta-propeller repeat protein [Rhodopila sp.]|uniref:PQQ-like beta-propeller repeat protein n=1 Tax=Rhodopila sp. TaxID=2480087 RepID=UPI003D09B7F0